MTVLGDYLISLGAKVIWALGDSSGTSVADISGLSHTGTATNAPTWGVTGMVPGDATTAATFLAASSQAIQVADHADFDIGTSGWAFHVIGRNTANAIQTFINKGDHDGIEVVYGGDGDLFDARNNGMAANLNSAANAAEAWRSGLPYQLICNMDRANGVAQFYRAGMKSGTAQTPTTATSYNNTSKLEFGTRLDTGNSALYITGTYQYVALLPALTASQIETLAFIADTGALPGDAPGIRPRGTGARNTGSETSYVITPALDLSYTGSWACLAVAYDNSGTNGADPYVSISDTNGNTWTSRQNGLNDPGAADAGSTLRIFTTPQDGGALTTSDTITVSFGSTVVTARAYALWEVIPEDGFTIAYGTGAVETAATASPTITTSSIANGDMVLGVIGREGNDTHTPDTDSTNGQWRQHQSAGVGTTTGGQQIASQWKRVTSGATQTYNPTFASSRDGVEAWVSFTQNAAGSPVTVTPDTATLTTATFAPTVTATANQLVIPSTASLVTTAFAPTVTASDHQTVTPDAAELALATFAPTVSVSDHQVVTPDAASLALTGFAPAVSATANVVVTPDAASLALTTFAPTVSTSDALVVTPDAAELVLTGFAPTVTATGNQVVTPSPAALSMTAFAPTVVLSDHQVVTPAPASLALTGFAPSVQAGPLLDWDVAVGVVSADSGLVGVVSGDAVGGVVSSDTELIGVVS